MAMLSAQVKEYTAIIQCSRAFSKFSAVSDFSGLFNEPQDYKLLKYRT